MDRVHIKLQFTYKYIECLKEHHRNWVTVITSGERSCGTGMRRKTNPSHYTFCIIYMQHLFK